MKTKIALAFFIWLSVLLLVGWYFDRMKLLEAPRVYNSHRVSALYETDRMEDVLGFLQDNEIPYGFSRFIEDDKIRWSVVISGDTPFIFGNKLIESDFPMHGTGIDQLTEEPTQQPNNEQ